LNTGKSYIQQKLSNIENLYRLLAENVSDVIWVLDMDLNPVYISPSRERMSGFTAEESLNMSVDEMITTESLQRMLALHVEEIELEQKGAADPQRFRTVEVEYYHKEGYTYWTEVKMSFIREEGEAIGILGITRDIDDRKRSEKKLREQEKWERLLIETTPDVIYVLDNDGYFTYMSSRFEEYTGISVQNVIGHHYSEFLSDEQVARARHYFDENLQKGQNSIYEIEFPLPGRVAQTELHVKPLYNENDEPIGRMGVARDITRRKIIENELKESESKWRGLYGNLPGGSFVVDSDYIIQDVNDLTCVLTGYSYEELVGEECSIICPKGPHKCPIFDLGKASIDNDETAVRHRDGHLIPVLKSARRMQNAAGDLIIENFLDITDIQKTRDALMESERILRERNDIIEKDLKAAQMIQRSLVQSEIGDIEGIDTALKYIPLDAIGGDYYSITPLSEGGTGVFIGDVTGHGVSAALYLSLLKATTDRKCRNYALTPGDYITSLNSELIGNMPMSFLTAIYGVFQKGSNGQTRFTFASAGHPHPLVWRQATGAVEYVNTHGTILGMFHNLQYGQMDVLLEKGDRIFLYTDGIPETIDSNKKALGYDRLKELIQSSIKDSIRDSVDVFMSEVSKYKGEVPFEDDIVLIGFEIL